MIVRGSLVERLYDEEGNVTEEVLMVPGGENPVVQVEKGRWHSLECLEPDTVLFEAKDGAWEPLAEEDIDPVQYNCENCKCYDALTGSYISFVEEDEFLSHINKYIDNAYDKSENDASGYIIKPTR